MNIFSRGRQHLSSTSLNRIALASWSASIALSLILLLVFLQPVPRFELDSRPASFDPGSAYQKMRELAKGYPGRATWTDSRKRAALWLKAEFRNLGYEPRSEMFDETIAGKKYGDLENVFAEKIGRIHPDQKIVIAAHYDIAESTVEGAMDDASGVGLVLELARIFSREKTDRTLVFLLTDSEEYGTFWGARAFSREYGKSILGVLNFDFLAPGEQTGILQLGDGLRKGFAPLWLRQLGLDALKKNAAQGEEITELTGLMELFQRAMRMPAADHGAFLSAGIPAVNWVGQTADFRYVMAHFHHTLYDVSEAMRPDSFRLPGTAAEGFIHTLDQAPASELPRGGSSYWKLTDSSYLPGSVAWILHFLAFVPFFTITFARILRSPGSIGAEALSYFKTSFALLAGYGALLLLPVIKVITRYEEFPGTQKTPLLYSPNLLALAVICGTGVLAYLILRPAHPKLDKAEVLRSFHLAIQALITLIALVANSELAILLLLFPAYTWIFIEARPRTFSRRVLNSVLLIMGPLTFIAALIYLTSIFHIGVTYWFILLSASYGLISPLAAILFLLCIALMMRMGQSYCLQTGLDSRSVRRRS